MNIGKLALIGLIVGLGLLLAISGSTQPALQSISFEADLGTPVFENGTPGTWDAFRIDPGGMTYHDGQFHMLYNAFSRWPGEVNIGYATSEDGTSWTRQSEEPVLSTNDVEFALVAVTATSVLIEDDGIWVLYFHTWQTQSANLGSGVIGRATADSPHGPWAIDPEPVLSMGADGEWDGGQVSQANVHRLDDGYRMYYTGADSRGFMRVGLALSDDGISWQKHDDPDTSEQIFASSDPVMQPAVGEWDQRGTYQTRITSVSDGWMMIYKSFGSQPFNNGLGIAYSEDGIVWSKDESNPILIPSGSNIALQGPALIAHDGRYWLYFEGQRPNPDSDVYLAIGE